MVAVYSVLAVTAVGLVSTTSASASCDSSALNTTVGTYTTDSVTTVSSVATLNNRGICDVARANRMSDPTIPFAADTEVIIPAEVCEPDDSSCFTVVDTSTTNFCLMGGPHLYYTQRNDTYRTIALERFNITLESVLTALGVEESQADVELNAGLFIKIPSCYPSQCTLQPYKFTYGTYKDLAEEFGASVGQIIAYNPTYSHSVAGTGDGPVLTMPMDCKALSDNFTSMT
ncbi:hypothetical protein PF005_g4053 [Phytophthora fragariae]|uniref:LysM domain-containing protein n=1 Tax=Phytophthora fragariae TaxID=53985 RepID=A0A6A3Z608_9STRA|nr:hypothetical protein PF003_g16436 [Phytophthora fragariae]KAE8942726.1 hypothetical protein PF009_g7533 [Phytophthora fragariae]KAE9024933.1 hypothetical protein PF011_g3272 [Phytophthora fragariae]KAE9124267.1 hypothetical protein PF010_g6069 [Phytophthora fragariae]KAE9129278.1 hypothetical protein PF007_g4950 [Phytophthora fragariae]